MTGEPNLGCPGGGDEASILLGQERAKHTLAFQAGYRDGEKIPERTMMVDVHNIARSTCKQLVQSYEPLDSDNPETWIFFLLFFPLAPNLSVTRDCSPPENKNRFSAL